MGPYKTNKGRYIRNPKAYLVTVEGFQVRVGRAGLRVQGLDLRNTCHAFLGTCQFPDIGIMEKKMETTVILGLYWG